MVEDTKDTVANLCRIRHANIVVLLSRLQERVTDFTRESLNGKTNHTHEHSLEYVEELLKQACDFRNKKD